jgi:ketosteroid isomerase-like protein
MHTPGAQAVILCMALAAPTPALPPDSEAEIRAIEAQIAKAVVGRDLAFVDRVWDDEFVYTGVRGEVKSKADILAEIKSSDLTFEEMRFEEIRIRTFGDTAIATGLAIVKGRSKQGAIAGEFRYTRVYVKRPQGWRLAAFQGTPVARSAAR